MRSGDEVLIVVMIVAGVIALVWFAILILFYITLMRCLQRIQPRNRDMEPGMVFLNLIPCFGLVWIFITVNKIGSSLQKEFYSRRWRTEGEGFGTSVGVAYGALICASVIPYIGSLFAIASLVCFIIYWIQIAGYSSRLAEPFDPSRVDDDYDDDYERRRLPRADRDRDYDDDRIREDRRDDRIREERRDDDYDDRIRAGD
jgi:hypothetical protein